MKKKCRINSGLFLFFILILNQACYEDKEGCLDVSATNFDVEADINCCGEDLVCCCTYPNLNLSISHKLTADTSLNFILGQALTIQEDSSQLFTVEDSKFYLTNLHLINSSTGEELVVDDRIELYVIDDFGDILTTTVEDNFSLITRNQFDYTIGSISSTGIFDQVSFDVGIEGLPNHTLTDSLTTAHALSIQTDTLQTSPVDGYVFNKIDLKRDTASSTTISSIRISDLEKIQLTLNEPLILASGFDMTINLRVNHLEWYKGINFVADTEEQIKSKIVLNTTNVFEIIE